MNVSSSHWIKQVKSIALQSQAIPMWGTFPAFPWESFSETFSSQFGIKQLTMTATHADWKKESESLSGIGDSFLHLSIELSPLKGHFFLVFPIEDFSKLSAWAMDGNEKNSGFCDPSLQKGFFRYLCAESMEILENMQIFPNLRARLIEAPLIQEEAYCVDIAIKREEETIWARAIFPALFHQSFKNHYTQDSTLSIPSTLYPTLFTNLSLCAGHVTLSQKELNKIRLGDFVLLDSCSYSPTSKKGTFQLELAQVPLFQTKIKQETIKILDYADYFEEQTTMNDATNDNLFEEIIEEEMSTHTHPKETLVSPKKVPVTLTVEVAHLKMSLDRLLKLKPGNFLELSVQIENGVSLMANGRCIGKGELLQIEDVIGVKITKLGE